MYRTPLLVPVDEPFDKYISRLTKPAKKNYRKAIKSWELDYLNIQYKRDLVQWFMALWEQQNVFGRKPAWTVGIDRVDQLAERNAITFFVATNGNAIYALHPVEIYGDYAYAWPVLYDKTHDIATFCWFKTIQALCESEIKHFDLGGSFHGTWVDLLKQPDDPILNYKWRYVPKDVKEDPDGQPPWERLDCSCGAKQIVIGRTGCKFCGFPNNK